MTTFIKLSLASMMVFTLSCDSAKTAASATTEEAKTETTKEMETTLLNQGYAQGTISYMKDSECTYIITDDKTGAKYDPVNMDLEKYSAFKKEGMQVYYKYRPLRRMNRCMEAHPIELEDMKNK